jgi:hypothetical protein
MNFIDVGIVRVEWVVIESEGLVIITEYRNNIISKNVRNKLG